MGSFAAVSEIILIIEGSFKKAGTLIAMYITAMAIIIYIALLKSRSVIALRLSAPDLALKSSIHAEKRFFLLIAAVDISIPPMQI